MTTRVPLRRMRDLVGEENIGTGASSLSPYFREKIPDARLSLVTPTNKEQLSDVMDLANNSGSPVYTVRRKYVDDPGIASEEGLLIDLQKMNTIHNIDARNLMAHVEVGVTFEQLQGELDKENLRLLMPAAAESDSVVRSYLDRDILLGSVCYRQPNLSIFHAVTSDGRIWKSGSHQLTDEGHADFREDQGPQFSPFFGASEDIFGIPYYGIVYVYPRRAQRRVLAFSFSEVAPALELLERVSRRDQCFECFAANNRFLSVLATGPEENADDLMDDLPQWTAVVSLEHDPKLVELWTGYVNDYASELSGKPLDEGISTKVSSLLESPWYIHERDGHRGRCLPISFYHHMSEVSGMFELVTDRAGKDGVGPGELGQLVVPVYFGGAAYCEVDLYMDESEALEKGRNIRSDSYDALLDARAFVDRPRGEIAEKVFSLVGPGYIRMIKKFKSVMDPKGLLNPDQLLEGV